MSKKIFKIIGILFIFIMSIHSIYSNYILISGNSMYPNLKDGEIVKISKVEEDTIINRFDIVIAEKEEGYNIIKRVIGLPYETIEYKDNHLYINGQITTEDFIDTYLIKTEDFSITLKNDEYFLLGDNREYSTDSRILGAFLKKSIKFIIL